METSYAMEFVVISFISVVVAFQIPSYTPKFRAKFEKRIEAINLLFGVISISTLLVLVAQTLGFVDLGALKSKTYMGVFACATSICAANAAFSDVLKKI